MGNKLIKKSFITIIIVMISLFITSIISAKRSNNYGDFDNVEYVRNYDGDTITFNIIGVHPLLGEKISIRVLGVDTPEIRGKCTKEKYRAQDAKFLVETMCRSAKVIKLKNVGRGKYFRILADVYCDGISVADKLIEDGFAVRYDGGTKIDWCEKVDNPIE